MNEAEQDTQKYPDRGQRYCPSEAEADNADRGLHNSDILRKPNSIILLLFIPQQKSVMRIKIKTDKNLKDKFLTPNIK